MFVQRALQLPLAAAEEPHAETHPEEQAANRRQNRLPTTHRRAGYQLTANDRRGTRGAARPQKGLR